MGIESKLVEQLRNSMCKLGEYVALESDIKRINGLTIQEIRDLFAAGYTLKPPGCPGCMADLATTKKNKRGRPKKTP